VTIIQVTAKFIFGQDHNTHMNSSSVHSFTGVFSWLEYKRCLM